jgi:hypothetical protein
MSVGTMNARAGITSRTWASRPGAGRRAAQVPIVILLLTAASAGASAARPATSFQLQGLFQFGPSHVAVAFTDSVNAAQATQPSHYAIAPQGGAPALTIQTAALQENQRTVILTTAAALPPAATYAVTVSGVTSRHGATLEPGGPATFTTVPETVTGIAEVQANAASLAGTEVTVIGQVFMTASSSGGTPSGYIQDGTGRGINLFGNPLQPVTDVLGSVVKVTGTVALFFTTVELTPFTATPIAADMPHLGPKTLSAAQAGSLQWEGTYIQTTATLTGPPVASGANNHNYAAADGGSAITFRVRNATGIDPAGFSNGDLVTGAGAGASFQTTFQITIGNAADFYKGQPAGDMTPPALVSAQGAAGANTVAVEFSEPVGAGATTTANYAVYPTANPGGSIAVTAAAVNGASVTLTLASPLLAGTAYTVAVSNVQDAAGNVIATGASVAFSTPAPAPFEVTGAFQFGADFVGVAFSKRVNVSQAIQIANYAFTPALAIAAVAVQENGQTAILRTSAPLPRSASYALTVSGITSATGDALAAGGPFTVATASETVVDIATIQADPATWANQTVTVIGQAYIPVGSRGGTPSGYIQDGSGRGLNVFGGSIQAAVNDRGSVAKVTGQVSVYFTTTEITSYSASAVAVGQPPLGARALTVAQANASQWEGTFIETTAELTAITASGASNYNYDASDGGAAITFRVGNGLGIPPTQFSVGDRVTGRGAGGAFQTTFQINIGNREDFGLAGAGPDVTPPTLGAASGVAGSLTATVAFSEAVQPAGAEAPANYRLYPAGQPGAAIGIVSATLAANARSVDLALAAPLQGGASYVLEVSNVADLAGNVIAAGSAATFVAQEAPKPVTSAQLRAVGGGPFPPVTLVRNLSRQGEVFRFEIAGPEQVTGAYLKAVCRIFDMRGRLVKVLFDGRLTGTMRTALAWDGRDESFELVPAGAYICHLSVTDLDGRESDARAPIVVAVRLKGGTP